MVAYNYFVRTKNDSQESADEPMFREINGMVYNLAEIHLKKATGGSCVNSSCHLWVDRNKDSSASICNHELDLGAPIFCGLDKKVAYLAQPFLEETIGCNARRFSVVHVPYLIDGIKKHVKLD